MARTSVIGRLLPVSQLNAGRCSGSRPRTPNGFDRFLYKAGRWDPQEGSRSGPSARECLPSWQSRKRLCAAGCGPRGSPAAPVRWSAAPDRSCRSPVRTAGHRRARFDAVAIERLAQLAGISHRCARGYLAGGKAQFLDAADGSIRIGRDSEDDSQPHFGGRRRLGGKGRAAAADWRIRRRVVISRMILSGAIGRCRAAGPRLC